MIDVNEIPFWAAGAQVVEEDMEEFAEDDVSDVDIYGSNTLDILDEELNHGRAFPTVKTSRARRISFDLSINKQNQSTFTLPDPPHTT